MLKKLFKITCWSIFVVGLLAFLIMDPFDWVHVEIDFARLVVERDWLQSPETVEEEPIEEESVVQPPEEAVEVEPIEEEPEEAVEEAVEEVELVTTQWFTASEVVTQVVTIKENPSGCNMPDEVCYMLDEAGVLGADDYDEAEANDSAVWTGGADHQTADQKMVGVLIPEGSYVTAYASGFRVTGGGFDLLFPECGEHCAWGFLARGWFAETHADRHVPIEITNLGSIGGMKYTRYAVPIEAGQFFSEDYLTDQAENALQFDNCGAGPEDCDVFLQAIFDYNDGSLTILRFTAEKGWEVLWSNVSLP